MIEEWVIDKLSPLKGENLIILTDPQRMIRAGARAVDGWAKENGFTVLFCSGNLALRERLFLRSSTGPNRAFEPQSLGRVRDPVRLAEGPTSIDAASQRRHFGFRLRLVDKLQPIGGGSGRGHPLSGNWATWMAPNVMPRETVMAALVSFSIC